MWTFFTVATMNVGNTQPLYEWENVCRLCLLEDGIKLPIFDEEGKQRRVSYKIQTCFPIVIYETDPLPKMICHKCLFKLETVFEFRVKCIDANTCLLKNLETYGANEDVQKYLAAVEENSKTQDSHKEVPEKINVKEHQMLPPSEAKLCVPLKTRYPRKSVAKQDEEVLVALNQPNNKLLCEQTIGAHGARVTRSGNVSGDADNGPEAANVFQEVFLDEASSDGFLPEQSSGDSTSQLQDVLAGCDADRVAQRKRETMEGAPSVLTPEVAEKEPWAAEKNPQLQSLAAKTTAVEPTLELMVNSSPTSDLSSVNNNSAVAKPVKVKKFVCRTCNFKSPDRLEMSEHLCALQMSYSCKLCSKHFYNKQTFRKHVFRATCMLSFKKCPQCGVSFDSVGALARHQLVHFKVIACTKEEQLHACDCGRRFVCKLMLASHRKTHTVLNGKSFHISDRECTYNCQACGEGFNNRDHSENHKCVSNLCKNLGNCIDNPLLPGQINGLPVARSDLPQLSFKCKNCMRVFFRHSAYANHIKIHNRPQAHKLYEGPKLTGRKSSLISDDSEWAGRKCKQCNVLLESRSAWMVHRKQHMTTCKMKKLMTTAESRSTSGGEPATQLQTHLDENHVDRPVIGIFRCSMCNKSFSSKEGKLRHQKIHINCRKYFLCKVCNKKLQTVQAYTSHLKTHKQLSCDTCHETFKNDEVLKTHICSSVGTNTGTTIDTSIGNTGTLPVFSCSSCPSLYSSRNALNAHMKSHITGNGVPLSSSSMSVVSKTLDLLAMASPHKKPALYKTSNGFKCGICGKVTLTLHGGRTHMKTHPSKTKKRAKKNFKCPFCSRGFISVNATYDHIAVNHPDAKVN